MNPVARVIATLRGSDAQTVRESDSWTAAALVLLATLPAFALIAFGVETARTEILERDATVIPWAAFGTVTLAYSLAFPIVAGVMGVIFGRPERVRGWVTVRHWAVLFLAWTLAGLWALTLIGLPFRIANAALLVGILGTLVLDIRLAQVAGGFALGAAVLVASVIGTLGMTMLLAGLQYYLLG